MRNIKSAAMLSAAAIGLIYMTACSSDVNYPDTTLTPAETGTFTVVNPDQSRVHNFGNDGTRTAKETVTMPDKVETGSVMPEDGTLSNGTTYTVREDVTRELKLASGTATVHVLEGARLSIKDVPAGVTIYNWGVLNLADNAKIEGVVYSDNNVLAVNLAVNGKVYAKGLLDTDGGKLTIAGTVVANVIKASDLSINENATVSTGYIKTKTIELVQEAIVTLDQNGLIDTQFFTVKADSHVNVEYNATNAAIVVRKDFVADAITTPKDVFDARIGLAFNNSKVNEEDVQFNAFDWQVCSSNRVVYVPEVKDCHPAFIAKNLNGVAPEGEVVELKKVAEVAAPKYYEKAVSATCLAVDGDKVYATYHTKGSREKGVNGCIESINNGTKISLNQALKTDLHDFNHLIIDGDKIVAVGSWKKNDEIKKEGGVIVTVPKNFTSESPMIYNWLKSNEEVKVTGKNGEIRSDYMNAGDGNCVARVNNKYIVAASHGYVAVNVSDLSSVVETFHAAASDETVGTGNKDNARASSKHIAINGQEISILSHDENGNAYIDKYTSSDLTDDNRIKLDKVIDPYEGKNVLAYNGTDLYACLGNTGLLKNGTLTKQFKGTQANADSLIPVNAVAFDENYIYVAAGSFLYVLDKDMNEVCHYYANSQKSANYVVVNGDKIYVAYGKDGVQVFELSIKAF